MILRRSPPLQRRPLDAEPLVVPSGPGTQSHITATSSAARSSLMKNLNLHADDHVNSDEYDQQPSSSFCLNNMDHKHPHHLLNSSHKLLSHKPSTTSTATYSTAPSRLVASSTSNANMTNPFDDPSHIIEASPSDSSTPSTVASDSPTPQTTHKHKPTSASHGPHPLCAIHSNTGLEGNMNTGLDGTVTAGFTAGTQSGLPIPGVTNKRVHTSTTVSSKRSHRSTVSKMSRRVKKIPRTAKRAVRRLLRRITKRRQRKEKTTVTSTWTAPQV